jgi:hypothetical protein
MASSLSMLVTNEFHRKPKPSWRWLVIRKIAWLKNTSSLVRNVMRYTSPAADVEQACRSRAGDLPVPLLGG